MKFIMGIKKLNEYEYECKIVFITSVNLNHLNLNIKINKKWTFVKIRLLLFLIFSQEHPDLSDFLQGNLKSHLNLSSKAFHQIITTFHHHSSGQTVDNKSFAKQNFYKTTLSEKILVNYKSSTSHSQHN